jgi:hypothetical protein
VRSNAIASTIPKGSSQAVTYERARHLDDVLTRRIRISIETFDRGVLCALQVVELMGSVQGGIGRASTRRNGSARRRRPTRGPESARRTLGGLIRRPASPSISCGASRARASQLVVLRRRRAGIAGGPSSRVWRQPPGPGADRGGCLPGAVGADQPVDLTTWHIQIDTVQRDDVAKGLGDPASPNCGGHVHLGSPLGSPGIAGSERNLGRVVCEGRATRRTFGKGHPTGPRSHFRPGTRGPKRSKGGRAAVTS